MATTPILGLLYADGTAQPLPMEEYDKVVLALEALYTVTTFTAGDTTPSVLGGRNFKTANSGSTTITNFDDGIEGQEIFIVLDANTILADNSNLKLNGGLSATGDDTITLVKIGSTWYEKCRSVN